MYACAQFVVLYALNDWLTNNDVRVKTRCALMRETFCISHQKLIYIFNSVARIIEYCVRFPSAFQAQSSHGESNNNVAPPPAAENKMNFVCRLCCLSCILKTRRFICLRACDARCAFRKHTSILLEKKPRVSDCFQDAHARFSLVEMYYK